MNSSSKCEGLHDAGPQERPAVPRTPLGGLSPHVPQHGNCSCAGGHSGPEDTHLKPGLSPVSLDCHGCACCIGVPSHSCGLPTHQKL